MKKEHGLKENTTLKKKQLILFSKYVFSLLLNLFIYLFILQAEVYLKHTSNHT